MNLSLDGLSVDQAATRLASRLSSMPLRTLPSLTGLQAFERAAVHSSFRLAAYDLALSPSAISHQIRGLEDYFGVRLFSRNGRSVRLTQAGETYFRIIGRALGMLEEASRDLMYLGRGGRKELRISAPPFFLSTVLIPFLSEFERRWPDLTLRMEGTYEFADFDRSDIDLAIRFGREKSAGLRLEPLLEVRGMPVCAPQLAPGGLTGPADFANHVLIHGAHQRRGWTSWLRDVGLPDLEPRGELWFDSVPAALDAAEHGLGIALAPYPLINGRKGFGQTLVPAGRPAGGGRTFHLVCRPEQHDARWIVAFRKWVADALRKATEARDSAAIVEAIRRVPDEVRTIDGHPHSEGF